MYKGIAFKNAYTVQTFVHTVKNGISIIPYDNFFPPTVYHAEIATASYSANYCFREIRKESRM